MGFGGFHNYSESDYEGSSNNSEIESESEHNSSDYDGIELFSDEEIEKKLPTLDDPHNHKGDEKYSLQTAFYRTWHDYNLDEINHCFFMGIQSDFEKFKQHEIFMLRVEQLNEIISFFDRIMKHVYGDILKKIPEEYVELLKSVNSMKQAMELLRIMLNIDKLHRTIDGNVLSAYTSLTKEQILLVTLHLSNIKPLKEINAAYFSSPDREVIDIYKNTGEILAMCGYKKTVSKISNIRIHQLAPNLVQLIGPVITNQLIQITNGLKNLVSIPNSNLRNIGKKYVVENMDFGNNNLIENTQHGVLYYTEIVQSQDTETSRKKCLNMLSGKVSLCARVDYSESDVKGETGQRYKLELEKKLNNFNEPPVISHIKALPIPKDNNYVDGKDKKKKKRGGTKITKQRNKFRLNKNQQLQNKMEFGKAEKYITDAYGEENGLGLAGKKLFEPSNLNTGTNTLSKNMKERLNQTTSSKISTFDKITNEVKINNDFELEVPDFGSGSNTFDPMDIFKANNTTNQSKPSNDDDWLSKF